MPTSSAKQKKFMRAVAKSPEFAKQVGVPQSVGAEFYREDKKMKPKKMATGGGLREGKSRFGDDVRKRASEAMKYGPTMTDRQAADFMGRDTAKRPAEARKVKPPKEVPAKPIDTPKPRRDMESQDYDPPVKSSPKKLGFRYKMASGGKVRGDGCATRGKTKGRFV